MRYALRAPVGVTRTLELALLPFVVPDLLKAVTAA